jgi:hypothetical protein
MEGCHHTQSAGFSRKIMTRKASTTNLLRRLAKRRKLACNALIRKAVLQWQGDPKFAPFESHRAKLAEPAQDPFG